MKKIITVTLLTAALFSCDQNQVAPSNDVQLKASKTVTTESALKSAISAAKAGDVITVSGTIKLTSTLKCSNSGTSSSKITFTGGTLDCSGIPFPDRGVDVKGSYWNITNMTIKNAPDNGLLFQSGGNNYVSKVTTTGNQDTGIQVYNGAYNVSINNCTSNNNYDTQNSGENADGYACKLSGGKGNSFTSCSASSNSDDGWDLYGQAYTVTIKSCTASSNGKGGNGDGNGFKLGSAGINVPHTVTNCTANNNKAYGYTGNGNSGHITLTGSGGSGNGKGLYDRIH